MGILDIFSRKNKVYEAGKALVQTSRGPSSMILDSEDNLSQREKKFKKFKRAYERVPLITAIIDVQADSAIQNFFFVGPNEEKLSEFADKINLMRFFHRLVKTMLLYGNGYVEIVKKGGEIIELKVLDPVYIDVYRTKTGDLLGYSQIVNDEKLILWGTTGDKRIDLSFKTKISSTDTIAHFKYNVIGSNKYGTSVVESLIPSLQQKLDMEQDLGKVLYKYVAPLIWAKVGNDSFPANEDIVNEISNTLRDIQAESEITTSHLVELGVLDFNSKGMDIQTPINQIESQIITGGQVPPVLLGRAANVDKAVAEVQMRQFSRHIKAVQREIKYEFEDNIIVKQGLGTQEDKLVWEKSEERDWEIEVDILRGLVTDGIVTPQKANDQLPPRLKEELPMIQPLNQQEVGPGGQQIPRPNQMKNDKITDNPNDPTQTTKNTRSFGKRVNKGDREDPRDARK